MRFLFKSVRKYGNKPNCAELVFWGLLSVTNNSAKLNHFIYLPILFKM